jgi:hypothetical protein
MLGHEHYKTYYILGNRKANIDVQGLLLCGLIDVVLLKHRTNMPGYAILSLLKKLARRRHIGLKEM